ncbi:MAG: hypothetical protein RJP96_14815 [Algiphilus sp.]|uniref:hypothetical protein n=1 Tax=Algiphilus sp. TaxID=1872431 RepID=UPI0032EC88FE
MSALKVYGLAAALAIAAGVWGYIQTLHASHAAERVAEAREDEREAHEALAATAAANEQITQRLSGLAAAIRSQRAQLETLRRDTRAITERIRRAPDDGCLDRPIPDGLRILPESVAAGGAGGMPAAADAGTAGNP